MTKTITASVGAWDKGAQNQPADVTVVQTLLTAASTETGNFAFDPKGVDGKISKTPGVSNTVKAIHAFQKFHFGGSDGVVEPGKATMQKLGIYAAVPAPPVPGNIPEGPLVNSGDYCFPLSYVPSSNYRTGGRRFGASRSDGTRKHAGCDRIVPQGTEIYAVTKGTITRGPYYFYHGTYAIEVDHGDFLARYCEIKGVVKGLGVGSEVGGGQLIAHVGQMYNSAMLHFELYSGDSSGPLTQSSKSPYKRRADLLDPTSYLEMWEKNLPGHAG